MRPLLFILCFSIVHLINGQSNYIDSIYSLRTDKDAELKDSTHSPLKAEQLVHFEGLHYFEPNESYRITAKFKQKTGDITEMTTSSGKIKKYRPYGFLKFKINGKKLKLTIYQSLQLMKNPLYKDYLFIPFTDLTNGESTYGGGRYLDIELFEGKKVLLDFNLCYNPYCAYTTGYNCPIPPKENFLNVKIEAGEKAFDEY